MQVQLVVEETAVEIALILIPVRALAQLRNLTRCVCFCLSFFECGEKKYAANYTNYLS